MHRKLTRTNPYWLGVRVVCGAALVCLLVSLLMGPGAVSSHRREIVNGKDPVPLQNPKSNRARVKQSESASEPAWFFFQSQEILENHAKQLLLEAKEAYKIPFPEEVVKDLRVRAAAAGLKTEMDIRHYLICGDGTLQAYKALSALWERQVSVLCALPELSKAKLDLMWEVVRKKMDFTSDREVMHFIATSLVAGRYHLTDGSPSLPIVVNSPDAATRTIASEMAQGQYSALSDFVRQRERAAAAEWMVDIGGNQGFVTALMAGVLRNASLVTVELVPANVVYILLNLILNGFAAELRSDAVPSDHPAMHEAGSNGRARARTLDVVNCGMSDGADGEVQVPHNPKRIFHSNLWADFTQTNLNSTGTAATGGPASNLKSGNVSSGSVTVRVPACTLPGLLAERGAGFVDVLKIDCEGCEYLAVPTWPPQLLAHVGFVLGELHGSQVKVFGRAGLQPGEGMETRRAVDSELTGEHVTRSGGLRAFASDRLAAGLAHRPQTQPRPA